MQKNLMYLSCGIFSNLYHQPNVSDWTVRNERQCTSAVYITITTKGGRRPWGNQEGETIFYLLLFCKYYISKFQFDRRICLEWKKSENDTTSKLTQCPQRHND